MRCTIVFVFFLFSASFALPWDIIMQGSSCSNIRDVEGCCNNETISRHCTPNRGLCYCHHGCYKYGYCCPDMSLTCPPRTCTGQGLDVGCCGGQGRTRADRVNQCYVPAGKCYCDPACTANKDCCADVIERSPLPSCPWRSSQDRPTNQNPQVNPTNGNDQGLIQMMYGLLKELDDQ